MDSGIHIVSRSGSDERFFTTNPATGEPVGGYPVASAEEVGAAVARARQAQLRWGALPQPKRSALLRRVAQLISAEKDKLVRAITSESGKPMQEALISDVLVAADAAVFCADYASSVLRTEQVPHANPALRLKRGELRWQPLGVVGIISPWNYPLSIPAADAFAAMAVGNSVVLKPSELTPQAALELERIIALALHAEGLEAGPSPLQVVTGLRSTGEALVASRIDKLIFTGSVATGRIVAVAAAERLLPVTLELGGKDAMVVLGDANVEQASSAAVWGALMNTGQTCISVERCYVDRKIYSRFVDLCLKKIAKLKVGNGALPDTDVGPLINRQQLRIVERQVEEARALGATVHAGGCKLTQIGPNFYAPTLITEVEHTMSLMREETFGPVLPIMPFSSDDEAVQLANDSNFGLAASVWGRTSHALSVARRIVAGAVLVNDLISGFAVSAAPHGGVKQSGIGRTHGVLGMREMVRPVFLDVDLVPGVKKLWWYPYAGNFEPMAAFAELIHARGFKQRALAAWKSLPALLRPRH